ncbi:MAG: sugar phosphate isomerase/epimerase family protein [Christensenellaceae bacterium]
MKFGTYFAYWENEWAADYAYYCKKVAQLGFDVLEVAAGGLVDLSDDELEHIKAEAKLNHVKITSCIGLPKHYNVASLDENVRRAGVAYVKRIIDAMDKVDSRTLGGIIYAYWPADYTVPINKTEEKKQSIKSVRELAEYAQRYEITLALETVNRFEQYLFNDAKEAVAFVKEVDMPNVKVMLDCFHMNIEEDHLGDAIRATGNYLGHFHIGEANRKVPGKGHMPWDEMGQALRDIQYQGCVVMEPFVKMGGTVGQDIKVFRDLSNEADEKTMDSNIAESLLFVKSKFV